MSATSAMAAPTINFAGGSGTLASGTTVIEDFEGYAANSSIGVNAFAYGSSNGNGARPAFGSTGNFAAVATGGDYSLSFAPTSVLSFVLGSLDMYNALTLHFADSTSLTYNGASIIGVTPPPFPDGNQSAAATNGVVTYDVGAGSKIVGADFTSSGVSFEFDNIATGAVPEPASWAMMILGMGAIGGMLRQRRQPRVALAF